ncbi:DNA mismatch repair protein msh6 [Ancistrocladus abbreviatus]
MPFLGKNRRDAGKRRPGDVNYDPRTLYLPPDFSKSLSGAQRQWWEFKSKHMDKVLFFKMGKFYELFEMDAHVGVRELDLQYMKGEQPHCGFPERNFSVNVEKLARKGYRVLVVEQTETPEQLEIRRRVEGSKDKVVKREICAVVTKGTLTEGEMMSANPDASYLMAVTESSSISLDQREERIYGVCVVDVATSRIIIGQIKDDMECSALCSLLSEVRPVEIIKPAKQLSPESEKVLARCARNPLINELVPDLEFWDADKTVREVKSFYGHVNDPSVSSSSEEVNMKPNFGVDDDLSSLPDVINGLLNAGEDGRLALSALGGTLFYLRQAFLDETLLRYAKFELIPCSGFKDVLQKPYMVLDAAALENLEIFENSRNGESSGTLYAQLNHCVTAFGKRLLKTWLARPLYHSGSIKARQDAISGLRGMNLSFSLEFRKELSKLPDMERLLSRLFASCEANGRNSNKIVLYEDAAKKQLQEFISTLRGCEQMAQACSHLCSILDNVNSRLLHDLLVPGRGLSDIGSIIDHFRDAFDWAKASSSGRIVPCEGVDTEYDSACAKTTEIESALKNYLKQQRKVLGDTCITFVTVGKESYLLEVPEHLRGSVPRDYELRSSKKGFFRYWTPDIKKLLGELSQAESEKESKLKSILQRLVGRFCEHHTKWRKLVSTVAELDVLISLAIASDYYEGPTCHPIISDSSNISSMPHLTAKSLGHPVLRSDSLGKGAFVPNDILIGGSDHASFILLTGPNMGGKSTLLRQVCLAVILAQVGADVPAEQFELSPVDRIFVRMGAKDHIMAGQSTFLTEVSETASMLMHASRDSLVALDELGRGTSTSDGQAIAGISS